MGSDFDLGSEASRSDDDIASGEETVSIGKANRKLLGSLGHVLVRFWEAQEILVRQVEKHPERFEGLGPWLEGAADLDKARPKLEGTSFALSVTPTGLQLGGMLSGGDIFGAAIWPALLRLPSLKGFWEQHLRGNVLETLLAVLPKAWLVDPTPLPPGTVIAGLEVGSWEEFDGKAGEFVLSSRWDAVKDFVWGEALDLKEALSAFPGDGKVLTKNGGLGMTGVVVATYRTDEKGVALDDAWYGEKDAERMVKVAAK